MDQVAITTSLTKVIPQDFKKCNLFELKTTQTRTKLNQG